MGLVKTKTSGLGVRMGVAYTSPEKGGDTLILRKIHVCVCIWRREIRDSEKRYGWVQLGWVVCNRARWRDRCYCGYTNAGRRLKNNMYVAHSNNKKYQDFFNSSFSCSIHLLSLIHLLMAH